MDSIMYQNLAYLEKIIPNSDYIAVIEPGLGGYREMEYIKAIEKGLQKNNISTFSIDPFNSLGESSGAFENATFDSHMQSLKTAINIIKQKYPNKKIIIVGHSVSAMVVLYYAAHNNDIYSAISLAPLVSGKIYENPKDENKKNEMKDWKKSGFRLKEGKNGENYKVSYKFVESLKNINLMDEVSKIKVPTLLIANESDKTTDLSDLNKLSLELNLKSSFSIIKDAPHLIKDEAQLKELENIIFNFSKF